MLHANTEPKEHSAVNMQSLKVKGFTNASVAAHRYLIHLLNSIQGPGGQVSTVRYHLMHLKKNGIFHME